MLGINKSVKENFFFELRTHQTLKVVDVELSYLRVRIRLVK